MKKFYSLLFMLMAFAVGVSAQDAEELSLSPGWNCSKDVTYEGPSYPASITMKAGNNYVYANQTINADDFVSYKIVFGEAVAEGQLLLTIEGGHMEKISQPVADGTTELTGTFEDIEFGEDEEGNIDRSISRLALQNASGAELTFTITSFTLVTEDGEEIQPALASNTSFSWSTWKNEPQCTIVPTEATAVEMWKFGQWGTLAHNFGQNIIPGKDEIHRFTAVSSQPFPADFQWKVIRGSVDDDASYPGMITEGETSVTLELTENNIKKSEEDAINYFTGIAIQCRNSGVLPLDVKIFYEVAYGNGVISREQLPIKVGSYGSHAEIIDPNPSMEQGENGLPIRVNIPGNWGDVKLWKETFSAADFVGYKIELAEKPEDEAIQIYYRTATHGDQGGVYVPWETNEEQKCEVSEDGTIMTGEFDLDKLEDDIDVLRFAMQNRTGNTVSVIIKNVWLLTEEGEYVETAGLTADGWNAASFLPVGGSYDEDGNIWDAYVQFNAANDYLGTYSGTVEEGTHHRITFYTEEPLPASIIPICQNIGFDANYNWTFEDVYIESEGAETTEFTVNVAKSYNSLYLRYVGEPQGSKNNIQRKEGEEENGALKVRFTKIIRDVIEGEMEVPSAIEGVQNNANVNVAKRQFFNASGVELSQPVRGINIVRETLSDGTVRSHKVVIK